jgi:hypothetical protein
LGVVRKDFLGGYRSGSHRTRGSNYGAKAELSKEILMIMESPPFRNLVLTKKVILDAEEGIIRNRG